MAYDIKLIVEDLYINAQASGPSSLKSTVNLCKRVIETCEDSGRKLVLVDMRMITQTFEIIDLYQLAKEVYPVALGKIKKCAMVQSEICDVESFLVTTMRNRGMRIRSFHDKEKALSWLLGGDIK